MANPNIVNVSSIVGGNAAWALTNTVTTTLLTVAADVIVKINSLIVTNIHGTNAATVSIEVNGIGGGATGVTLAANLTTQVRIASTMNVPADDSLVLIDKPIYLMEADVLEGGASVATAHIFISYEVINDA